jgi:uncharacterized Ntn-hydrolase superfamily protein
MTYSIVARCPDTGRLGVAVQSHFFSVGSVVPWVEAGVGAVATQATAEVAHGPNGLERLRAGQSPDAALGELITADPFGETRQVGIVDSSGRAAAHTGTSCIREASHVVGDGFTTHANMMENVGVAEAMAEVFAASHGPLAERMLGVLDAAEALGGDIRGRQSAALVVAFAEPSGNPGHDLAIDVRVDDHADPLGELRRLVALGQSYRRMDEAETAMTDGDLEGALAIFADSVAAHPDSAEFAFWYAVVLAGIGRMEDAKVAIAPVFTRADGARWRELLRRLPPTGTIPAELADALARDDLDHLGRDEARGRR